MIAWLINKDKYVLLTIGSNVDDAGECGLQVIRSNPCKNKGLTVKNEFNGKARSDYSETVKC